MNTHELLEMASLDAMGLLDPEEREAFERAFRAAPPPVQAQIRREQLRFSSIDEVLPQVDPPLGLRARVIAAVREAMQSMAGRRTAEAAAPALRSPYAVSRFWRVGAIGAIAAAIVLGFFMIQVINANHDLSDTKITERITELRAREFGQRFESMFFNPRTQLVQFAPAPDAPDSKGSAAMLMFDPTNKTALLEVHDLPAAGDYEVLVEDAHGNRTVAVIRFKAESSRTGREIIHNFELENAKRLIIKAQGTGKAVLTSQRL